MSRSGYSDDCENVNLWRANVARATDSRRGQRFFLDLVAALDAMPTKRLIGNALGTEQPEGDVCALGCLARRKGAVLDEDDAYDYDKLGKTFGIASMLAQEVMYENDEGWRPYPRNGPETPEERWQRVRKWAESQLHPAEAVRGTTKEGDE